MSVCVYQVGGKTQILLKNRQNGSSLFTAFEYRDRRTKSCCCRLEVYEQD